jgi:hypothetical protein
MGSECFLLLSTHGHICISLLYSHIRYHEKLFISCKENHIRLATFTARTREFKIRPTLIAFLRGRIPMILIYPPDFHQECIATTPLADLANNLEIPE